MPNPLQLNYDYYRGGFEFVVAPAPVVRSAVLFQGLLHARHDSAGRIVAIRSFWDHGGLPLHALHCSMDQTPPLRGVFPFNTPARQFHQLALRQNQRHLTLWFGTEPLPSTPTYDHSACALWLSTDRTQAGWPVPPAISDQPSLPPTHQRCPFVLGIQFRFPWLAANYPISSIEFVRGDFK